MLIICRFVYHCHHLAGICEHVNTWQLVLNRSAKELLKLQYQSASNKQSISTRCFIHILPPCIKNLGNPFSNLIISPLPYFLLPWASLNNMLTSLSFIFNWSVPCYFPCRLCLVRRQRQQYGDSVLCTSTTTWKMLWDDFMCRRLSLKRVKNWSVAGALDFVLLKHIRLNQR